MLRFSTSVVFQFGRIFVADRHLKFILAYNTRIYPLLHKYNPFSKFILSYVINLKQLVLWLYRFQIDIGFELKFPLSSLIYFYINQSTGRRHRYRINKKIRFIVLILKHLNWLIGCSSLFLIYHVLVDD